MAESGGEELDGDGEDPPAGLTGLTNVQCVELVRYQVVVVSRGLRALTQRHLEEVEESTGLKSDPRASKVRNCEMSGWLA